MHLLQVLPDDTSPPSSGTTPWARLCYSHPNRAEIVIHWLGMQARCPSHYSLHHSCNSLGITPSSQDLSKTNEAQRGKHGGKVVWKCIRDIQSWRRWLNLMKRTILAFTISGSIPELPPAFLYLIFPIAFFSSSLNGVLAMCEASEVSAYHSPALLHKTGSKFSGSLWSVSSTHRPLKCFS